MVISIIVEPLKHEFGLSDSQIGLLGGAAFSIPLAIVVLPIGWLIDRANRRLLLGGMVAVWSLLTATGASAANYWTLLLARIGVGAAEAGAHPANLSLIGDMFPPRRRGTAVGIYTVGASAGPLVAFILGALALKHFGWRSVFLIAGAPGLIIALVIFFTFVDPQRGRFDEPASVTTTKAGSSALATFRTVLRTPSLLHAILAHAIGTGVQFSLMSWVVSFLVRIHGMAPHQAAGWIGFGVGAVQIVGSLAVGVLTDRYARGDPVRLARVPAIASVLCCVAGLTMVLSSSAQGALGAIFFEFLMTGGLLGPGYALIIALSPANERGSTMSLGKMAQMLIGDGFFVYFTGLLSDLIGGPQSIQPALAITLVGFLWAAFHFWMSGRATRRRRTSVVAAQAAVEPA